MPLRRNCHLNRLYFSALLVSDFLILALSILLAVQIRFGSINTASAPFSAMAGTWIFFAIAEILLMMVEDLYAVRTTVNKAMNMFRTIRMMITISIFFIVVLFVTHFPAGVFICSRLAVFIMMILWLAMTIVTKLLIVPRIFPWLLRILQFGKISLIIFGSDNICGKIRSTLLKSPIYRSILNLSIHSDAMPDDPDERHKMCMDTLESEKAAGFIMVFDEEDFNFIARFSLLARRADIPFTIYSRRIPELGYFDPWVSIGSYGALSFCCGGWAEISRMLWRLSDILIALTGLLLFLPVIAVTIPAIALSSPGGILYKQTRIGYMKKPFSFFKFRSMRVDAEDKQSTHKKYFVKYVNGDAATKLENGSIFKTVSTKAVTPIGRIIRKTSIDELPQIRNVLRGDMSIVGPRPCIDYELEFYTSEWLQQRFTVKPGLTGIWQVYGRSRLGFEKSQFLDFVYVLSRTDGINIRLILKTFPVILFGKGGL
ncbi:MAG: sugar transferase [Candidatus Aegiribacteria sp.]|nr:sugar transferase [Candidatus Aegiribacteria sp.]